MKLLDYILLYIEAAMYAAIISIKQITALQAFNYIIQVFGIRLGKSYSRDEQNGLRFNNYCLLYNVVPFTGWNSSYRAIIGDKTYIYNFGNS